MTAAVYSDVIAGGGAWDCETCGRDPEEWTRRGRCTGPLADGGLAELPIVIKRKGREQSTSAAYPIMFDTCPRGLLRRDIYPAENSATVIVSQAAYAEATKRWPDLPARLWELVVLWNTTRDARLSAYQNAQMTEGV